MIKMILADDEPIIIRGIRKLIDWEKLGISIVGEYESGSSAMEGILTRKPDVALLDISMPGMNGIEILKSIRQMELSTRVIFISGFQDFEYAKAAITYGAVDYLLKPVIRDELLRAMEKALAPLSWERTEGGSTLPGRKETGGQEQSILLEDTVYLPVLAEILFDGTESEQEKKLIRFSVSSFLEEYLTEEEAGVLFSRDVHIVMILKGMDSGKAQKLLFRLWEQTCQAAGKKIIFVMGQVLENMGMIPEEYEKCLDMERYFFFEDQIETPVLRAGEEVFARKAGMEELTGEREKMIGAILSQNRESFEQAFEEFAQVLCLAADGRKEDACYYFCSAVRTVEEKIQSLNLEGLNPDMKPLLERGRACRNFAQMKGSFKDCLEEYPALLKQSMETSDRRDITRAKAYIEEHYRENLTLEVMAGVMYMNSYYFSSFFKKNAGENFKDYLNRIRIEHAVPLLVTTDMKAYEIADEVGFRDVRSFTEVFSRAYGETPAGYRKRVLEEGHSLAEGRIEEKHAADADS